MMGQIRKTIETLDRTLTHAVNTLPFNRHSTKILTHLIEISCFSVVCCYFTILLSLFRIVLSSFHHHHKQFTGLARWLTSHMKEFHDFLMGISKTEINLRRLLAAAPQQQNQAKLIHYVATLREQLEQLAEERTPEGLPRISKAQVNDYSEKIEAIASKLVTPLPPVRVSEDALRSNSLKTSTSKSDGETQAPSSPGLRRRFVPASNLGDRTQGTVDADTSEPVKLDAQAHAHIEKQRKLQESLTDEMVGLARQLKESSLLISQSVQNTEKVLDSTEKAIEQSLASTGHTNMRAMKIYSESSKTTCFTWLLMLVMTCIFIMVVLLIRVT